VLIFTRGIPTFSNEGEAWAVIGVFPKIFPYCIRPIYCSSKCLCQKIKFLSLVLIFGHFIIKNKIKIILAFIHFQLARGKFKSSPFHSSNSTNPLKTPLDPLSFTQFFKYFVIFIDIQILMSLLSTPLYLPPV